MTREDIKTIIDIVHETIYGFFDVCDEEETPMTDKDKLLLKINKAICTNIKALSQEPCDDAISRQDAIRICEERGHDNSAYYIRNLPPVTPQPKTGHWIRISTAEIYECSECGQNVMTSDICVYKFCHGCGAKMVDPQESEEV